MKVSIQGARHSFHDQAARQWFKEDGLEIIEADTFRQVFESVRTQASGAAVVAIENTLYGSINQVYDLIEEYQYPIVGEIHLPIHHQLIGTNGTAISQIYSHPVALAQCEQYLNTHYPDAKRIEYYDTAAAVSYIKQLADPHAAAIASADAATYHNMDILEQDIEDNPHNFTRFLVIDPSGTAPRGANRASLVMTTDHTPGALANVLTQLARHDINLAKLQSRPIVGQPWHYKFYLVIDAEKSQINSLKELLHPYVETFALLGAYKHNPAD
jgi:prephenate dehydratase